MNDEQSLNKSISLLTLEKRSSFVSSLRYLNIPYGTTRGVRRLLSLLEKQPDSYVVITVPDKSIERVALRHALVDCEKLHAREIFLLGRKEAVEDLQEKLKGYFSQITCVITDEDDCGEGQVTVFELLCEVCDVGANQILQDRITAALEGRKADIGALCEPAYFSPPLIESPFHENPMGGDQYPGLCVLSSFESDSYQPKSPLFLSLIEEMEEEIGRTTQVHLHRVTYLVYRLMFRLGIPEQEYEPILATAMLHLFPEAVDNVSLSFLPITGETDSERRGHLCDALRRNASTLQSQFGIEDLGVIFRNLAAVLSFDQSDLSALDHKYCSILALAIIVDRECWWEGYFSGYGAYEVFRWLENGNARLFEGAVVRLMVKILLESIEIAHAPKREPKEDQIRLCSLRSGMRLANELRSLQGTTLIEAGTLLDEAQIVSLWKLAMIKGVEPITICSR